MGDFYLIIVIALFLFAAFDLMVGVSNDAVNFLNSALGSKAGSRKTILIIASLGILVGSLFSSGMMEVARKGIFHPEFFTFADIMLIFLAVMITDVILLDVYNTLRLPTSTTVSIVFELLGAATAIALLKIVQAGEGVAMIWSYINSEKALEIITGILMSIVIAFAVGAIIQYIVRFFFTFSYKDKLKVYGPIWGGIAVTAITYFLLLKGLKGSSLVDAEIIDRIKHNTVTIVGMLFAFWTLIMYLCVKIRRINIPKIIVLIGTFALAMAFAGNDLVNFIGVPIAGFTSYNIFAGSGIDPSMFMMDGLAGKVPTPFLILLIAGGIMVVTLRYSEKAKSVTETEIGLGRDSAGHERFAAGFFSRALVGGVINTHSIFSRIIPKSWAHNIHQRFAKPMTTYQKDAPAFDLIRASVNLTVASVLIAIATSMKLPLSTTYVTFMVAMGASLADGVRGRDSAVYRVSGVLTVIGGRFMTAISAFIVAGIIALILFNSHLTIVLVFIVGVIAIVYSTHLYHKRTTKAEKDTESLYAFNEQTDLKSNTHEIVLHVLNRSKLFMNDAIGSLSKNNRKTLTSIAQEAKELSNYTNVLKSTIHSVFQKASPESLELGPHYVKIVVYIRKITNTLENTLDTMLTYIDNHHPEISDKQKKELTAITDKIEDFWQDCMAIIEKPTAKAFVALDEKHEKILEAFDTYKSHQFKRVKDGKLGVRNTVLYMTLLVEAQNFIIYHMKLMKSYLKVLGKYKSKK